MKPRSLPGGAWKKLFPRALALIDEIGQYGGLADPFWTLGGGTVLMFRYRHRLSKDIDIFVPDPQYLGFVTPRLSDTAADLTQDYTEQPGSFVKLQFEEGEIDFVASPNLLADAWEAWDIGGRSVKVETAAEIIAKKMYHRGDRATARDLFDFALVIEREPQQLLTANPFMLRHREAFLSQVRQPHASMRAAFDAIATLDYAPSFDHCASVVEEFLVGV
ncbi:nucleotidyl transferase AbiEii/AbiGii toxin family protein [Hydrogenophaga sp. BPS33]|uniref:nucleotidyl transferase AbiEii/AbiGii toxin family protein n=1 Tax=Hydrogenophaga sp. BPS33 TaxID=2651974 RepID=UPI00131F5D8E|nr:nucleotidyl transferase AbiEii/AbiGii toxin family protein [Hydrogenophaga sp. BPS33]QHE85744.1 nucleotidyl transferase AbiEii/AbiGii toxin family protein [Hydrogenophaga sp. BPS33]